MCEVETYRQVSNKVLQLASVLFHWLWTEYSPMNTGNLPSPAATGTCSQRASGKLKDVAFGDAKKYIFVAS